jgi:hypothetical protein
MLMRALLNRATAFLSLAFVLVLPTCCFAQASLEPTQLPAQASFYLIWRGTPQGDIRQTNALLSFWDDPDCAPLRSAIVDALMSDSNKQKDKPALSRDELTQYASLLDNPFVLGYISRPDDLPAAKTPATGAPAWQASFSFTIARARRHCSPRRCCACVPRTPTSPKFPKSPWPAWLR